MASVLFNGFKKKIMDGSIDLDTDTIKVALLAGTFVANVDSHTFWSDVKASEVTGTGYVTGGQALASKAVIQDNTNDKAMFDATDVTWPASTITARYAVLYKDTGTATTSPLICCFDFGADKSSSNGDFTIQWNTGGILTLT